jgi:hypothetical protein
VETSVVAAAPIDVVWARVADASSWSTWGEWNETVLDREGEPAPDGTNPVAGTSVKLVLARFLPEGARRLAASAAADASR